MNAALLVLFLYMQVAQDAAPSGPAAPVAPAVPPVGASATAGATTPASPVIPVGPPTDETEAPHATGLPAASPAAAPATQTPALPAPAATPLPAIDLLADVLADEPVTAAPPAAAVLPSGYVSLEEVLKTAGAQFASIDVLENEVTSLNQMLDQLVLGGPESPDKMLEVTGIERELETLGVTASRAAQISDMSDEVRALRARLQLLNLRAASVTTTDEEFKPIEQMQPYDPRSVEGETAAPDAAAATEPAADAADAAAQIERTPSPDPDREAVLAFRQGDMLAVLDILEGYHSEDLAPDTLFVLGSALVSVDRLPDARAVFDALRGRSERSTLARAATRQIERIDHLMNGIVSLPPELLRGGER